MRLGDTPISRQRQIAAVSWQFDELSDNNALGDGLSLISKVEVNEQILEVILPLGNDAILVVFPL